MNEPQQKWTETIEANHSLFDLKLKEVWRYKDLIYMFVKRDFVSSFKQTILGPIWFFINPILTTITYLIILEDCQAPYRWSSRHHILSFRSHFMELFFRALLGTTATFTGNASIFGKVYFPRLVTPISIVISNLMRLSVQFLLFLIVWGYYLINNEISPNWWVLATPFY
jgi:lipopolysaccharide transport system permease protein